jgi:sigma-E factor negative regulatory protein RseB
VPKDHYRYGYRYWIDKDTGMLLRCDLKDEDNNVVEHMMFTSLTYLDQSPSFKARLDKLGKFKEEVVDEPSQNITPASSVSWQVENPPEGFMLTQSMMHYSKPPTSDPAEDSDDHNLLHLVYSDGLASVSVFIESDPDDPRHLVGPATMGVVNAYGQAFQNHFITVVGEVPEKTVKRMAQSLVKLDH